MRNYLRDRHIAYETEEGKKSRMVTANAAQGSILGPWPEESVVRWLALPLDTPSRWVMPTIEMKSSLQEPPIVWSKSWSWQILHFGIYVSCSIVALRVESPSRWPAIRRRTPLSLSRFTGNVCGPKGSRVWLLLIGTVNGTLLYGNTASASWQYRGVQRSGITHHINMIITTMALRSYYIKNCFIIFVLF